MWSSVRLSIGIFASVPPFFNFQSKDLPANSRRISGRRFSPFGGREATTGNVCCSQAKQGPAYKKEGPNPNEGSKQQ